MREYLVRIWRKIMRSEYGNCLVKLMILFFETRIFNFFIDFLERCTSKEKLKEKKQFFNKNSERIKNNIKFLADEKSKRVYENILKYRGSLNRKYLKNICDKIHYFDLDIVKFNKKEIFLDCGAYTGDTVLELADIFYKKLKIDGELSVICCEPDKKNNIKCYSVIEKLKKQYKNFQGKIIEKGIWKEKSELYFEDGNEYSSKISNEKKENLCKIEVDSIDNIIKNFGGGVLL